MWGDKHWVDFMTGLNMQTAQCSHQPHLVLFLLLNYLSNLRWCSDKEYLISLHPPYLTLDQFIRAGHGTSFAVSHKQTLTVPSVHFFQFKMKSANQNKSKEFDHCSLIEQQGHSMSLVAGWWYLSRRANQFRPLSFLEPKKRLDRLEPVGFTFRFSTTVNGTIDRIHQKGFFF